MKTATERLLAYFYGGSEMSRCPNAATRKAGFVELESLGYVTSIEDDAFAMTNQGVEALWSLFDVHNLKAEMVLQTIYDRGELDDKQLARKFNVPRHIAHAFITGLHDHDLVHVSEDEVLTAALTQSGDYSRRKLAGEIRYRGAPALRVVQGGKA